MTVPAEDFRTPGQLLEFLLNERGWSQRVLAIVLGIPQSVVARLVGDKRPIDAPRALSLSEVFEVPAERFLELQRSYDLAQARLVTRPDPDRATRAQLFGSLPIAEMITRGWLHVDDMRDVQKVEASLVKFFGVKKPEEIEILPHAARRTNFSESVTPAQTAWLYRVREIAAEMIVPRRYSKELGLTAINKLETLLNAAQEARKVPRILAESGIRYVIVESLSATRIDGACFWLDGQSPVIGMSLRYDRMDNFWFVLRHELEHVLRGHGQTVASLDYELERERAGTGPDVPEEERLANEAASNFCVPRAKLESFVARKAPIFAERDILGFANTLKIHPALVAGQLQHLTGRYERFRAHLVKIKSAVAPSAVVDGWGDIASVGL
jgi:HTH-type transcriptional regulator / antitoxin HigA